jgi:hypothetical protein
MCAAEQQIVFHRGCLLSSKEGEKTCLTASRSKVRHFRLTPSLSPWKSDLLNRAHLAVLGH